MLLAANPTGPASDGEVEDYRSHDYHGRLNGMR